MSVTSQKYSLIQKARSYGPGHRFWLECLIFLLIFLICSFLQTVLIAAGRILYLSLEVLLNHRVLTFHEILYAQPAIYILLLLFSSAIFIVIPLIYCRFFEKRSFESMGFHRRRFLSEYAFGFLAGSILLSASVLLCIVFGAAGWEESNVPCSVSMLGIYLAGYLVQGMGEEVLCRGYFMLSTARRSPVVLAVAANSVIFALLHIQNSGIAPLPLINLALFGIFISLWVLWRGSLWSAAAIHSAWNFVQGNIFGVRVSGIPATNSLVSLSFDDSKKIINGGDFGLEGGICVTATLLCAILIVATCICRQTKSPICENALSLQEKKSR